jgi:hypothetical protein
MSRPFTQTSASQHDAYLRCKRYWYFGWRDRIERPTTEPQQRGKDIHKETEHYLLTGEFRDSEYTEAKLNYRPYVESLAPHLPPPKSEELIIEQRIWMPTIPGVHWLGFIDIGYSGGEMLQIKDIKSTSNFRYNKTPEELSENIQLLSYARWAYEELDYRLPIEIGHYYVKTTKGKVPKKPKVKPVSCVVDRDHVSSRWDALLPVVEEMRVVSETVTSAHDLPPTVSACGMYDGCPFQAKCGITASDFFASAFGNKNKKGKDKMSSFLSKLKKAKSSVPEGIVSDDAAPRETTGEEAEKIRAQAEEKAQKAAAAKAKKEEKKAKAAAAKAKKAKKEAEAAEAEAENEADSETEPTETTETSAPKTRKRKSNGSNGSNGSNTKGFVLYIDCQPVKNVNDDGPPPTLFEDWFATVAEKMNAIAAESNEGLASYWGLGFADQKALLTHVVEQACEKLPTAMIASSSSLGARDALSLLIPHAHHVIRG